MNEPGQTRRARVAAFTRAKAPWLVLATSLAATSACTALLARAARGRDEARFQSEAREASTRILDRLELYKAALRGAASLFSSQRGVTPAEFAAFVRRQNVRVLYPGVLGVGWVKAGADVDPAYVEPRTLRSLPALSGVHEAVRREAMEVSRDRGGAQMTGLLPMATSPSAARSGFVLFLPVYAHERFPPASVAERRQELVGFVFAPVVAGELFGDVLLHTSNLRVLVYDGPDTGPGSLYYASASASNARPRFRKVDTLFVTGHAWTVVLESTPALEGQLASFTVGYAAGAGLLTAALLFALTWSLARTTRAAEGANRAKSAFLSTMSHELRTPLNVIMGYADLLDAGIPEPLPPASLEQVNRIQKQARHLLGLIDAIIQLARTEARIEGVSVEPVDIDALIRSVVQAAVPLAAKKGLRLQYRQGASGRGHVVRTDAAKVRQIGLNLLANAIKFTPAGEVVVETARDSRELFVRVSDTGIGVAPEARTRIFTAFWQADSGLSRGAEGAGLGLAVSRNLARLLGGDVTCESSSGKGSTFTLRLPAEPT